MRKLLLLFTGFVTSLAAMAVARFPKPDFTSGYEYPDIVPINLTIKGLILATPQGFRDIKKQARTKAGLTAVRVLPNDVCYFL